MTIHTKSKEELIIELHELQQKYDSLKMSKETDICESTFTEQVSQDVADHNLAKNAVWESEARYRGLLQNLEVGIVVHAPDTSIIMNNSRAADLLGLTDDQLKGKAAIDKAWEFRNEDNTPLSLDGYPVNWIVKSKKSIKNEIFGIYHPGKNRIVWVTVSGFPVLNDKNEIVEIIISFIDVSVRKQAEEALRKSEARYRLLYEYAPLAYQSLTVEGVLIDVNPTWLNILGYKREEVIGKYFSEFMTPESAVFVKTRFPRFVAEGELHQVEFEMLRKDGSSLFVSYNGRVNNDEFGTFKQTHCVFSDITERKKAEKALQESESKFKAITEISPLAIYMSTGMEQIAAYINPTFVKLFGYTLADVPTVAKWWPLAYPDEAYRNKIIAEWQEKVEHAINTKSEIEPMDVVVTCKDGSEKNIIWGYVSTDFQNWAFGLDITDQKNAKAEINKLNQILKQTGEIANVGGWEIDVLTMNLKFTDETYAIYELPVGSIPTIEEGMTFYAPEAQPIIQKAVKDAIEKNIPYDIEVPFITAKGNRIWVRTMGMTEVENGKVVRLFGAIQNITKLKESEGKYRRMVEHMNSGVAIYEPINNGTDFKIIDFNKAAERITNTSAIDVVGSTLLSEFPNMDKSPLFIALQNVCKSGIDLHIPPFFYKDNQREGWRENYIYKLPSGEIVAIFDDVTKRKNAEINLQNQNYELGLAKERAEKSEDKYRDLYTLLRLMSDTMPDMLWAKDLNNKYLFANKAMCENLLNAKNTNEPIGKTDLFFAQRERDLHPDNPTWHTFGEICANTDTVTLQHMKTMQFEEYGNVKGEFLFLEAHKTPLVNSEGVLIGVVGTGRDMTIQKKVEKELIVAKERAEKSEAKFRFFFDRVGDSIFIYDPNNFAIIEANEATSKTYGYDREELIGMSCLELSAEVENSKIAGEKIKKEGEGLVGVRHHKKKNGTDMFVQLSGYKIVVGEQEMVFAVCHDITNTIKAEEELIAAKERAEESDRLKSAFLANMSHEIRTPMNGILGFAELLKEPDLESDKHQAYINIIEKSGNRMLNIINDIVDISKIESGLMNMDIQETCINEQIEYIYTFFKPEVEAKGMTISYKNCLPANEAIIKTDREKVFAILTNLVKNAIKYTPKGIIEFGYILVNASQTTSKPQQSCLQFFVKDTGIGIPKNRQEAIFERFIQADISKKEAYQGAGLGLAITKAYIEMLGGRIWVESEQGVGSCFYFNLPYLVNEKQEIEPEKNSIPLMPENTVKNLKFLIAEDDETSEMLLSIIVSTLGDEILKAKTGKEAVELCRTNPDIDVIMMDIQMPVMNGYEATRQIRQFNKNVVIIAQTAFGLSGDREKSLEAGCNDYISKPIVKNELFSILKRYFVNK